ncbi:MAG: precorrin-8X methylmutase [Dehalococcoidia bacterium]|nr:precorrin-8X methylmutase [Dehalococcoidia bacterium]
MLQEGTLLSRYRVPPDEIEARSFEIIGGLIPTSRYSSDELEIVKRVVHTTGDPSIVDHLRIHPRAIASGLAAIKSGSVLFTDVKMAAAGVNRQLASRFGCEVACLIDDPAVAEEAMRQSVTRAAAGVSHFSGQLEGAIVAIGNAPTALLALLDLVDSGCPPPALVIGVPVGFVGAAEAKKELVDRDLSSITVEGTRGGSTIAVAIVNALLKIAAADQNAPV